MANTQKFASVLLETALDKPLEYSIPESLAGLIRKGMRVEVPVRGHARTGFVLEVKETSDFQRTLPITRPLSTESLLSPPLFELALWMARYYAAPLRQVLKAILPASIRKNVKPKQQFFVTRAKTRDEIAQICIETRGKKGAQIQVLDLMLQVTKGLFLTEVLEETGVSRSVVDSLVKQGILNLEQVRVDRSPFSDEEYFLTKPKTLNQEQQSALDLIRQNLDATRFFPMLLHGITGSGKTEIYMQAIDHALKQGKGAIYLVPEISLTLQAIERLRSRFREKIAILHSNLSDGERYDTWHNIRSGQFKIVVGARSALFCPVENLGLIIVDEEHDPSYKQQDEAPCYHARDVAVMHGKFLNAAVILGSATPSLESYHNALSGKYTLATLQARAEKSHLPEVTLIDMRKEFEKRKGFTPFSDALLEGIEKRCKAGEQTLLFLNRRGYHTALGCERCGESIKCNHCDTSLTFHKGENHLACHLCGFEMTPVPKECPKCKGSSPLKFRGMGCELAEKALAAIFPEIRTLRLDADTTKHKGSHQKILRDFATGKADVLIGTQMIAKGLHFPEVTLVGVLNCDASLQIPDFRASEHTFQLITQVAGRAGRGVMKGEVILQTSLLDNETLLAAKEHDYLKFYRQEIQVREAFGYPPFSQLAKVSFSGEEEEKTRQLANAFRKQVIQNIGKEYEIHPVNPSGHARVKNHFRFQFLVKGKSAFAIGEALLKAKEKTFCPRGVYLTIDINPLSTFF